MTISSFSAVARPVLQERRRLPLLALLAALLLAAAPPSQAQSGGLVDGVTLNLGLGIYQGELDRNVSDNPIEFFALGEISASAYADRALSERFLAEAGLVYYRFNIEAPRRQNSRQDANSMGVNVFAFDVTGGFRLALFGRPGFVRLHGGVGPALVLTSYNLADAQIFEDQGYTFEEQSPRFLLTFPVSLVLQDAWRFGVRFTGSDFLDSTERTMTGPDVISSIHVGYRFEL